MVTTFSTLTLESIVNKSVVLIMQGYHIPESCKPFIWSCLPVSHGQTTASEGLT